MAQDLEARITTIIEEMARTGTTQTDGMETTLGTDTILEMASILVMDTRTGITTTMDLDSLAFKVQNEGFKMDIIISGLIVQGLQVIIIIIRLIHSAMATITITTTTIIMAQITV